MLVPRDEEREGLGRIAMILRGAGDSLRQPHGRGAVELLDEALDDAEREIARSFGPTETDGVGRQQADENATNVERCDDDSAATTPGCGSFENRRPGIRHVGYDRSSRRGNGGSSSQGMFAPDPLNRHQSVARHRNS